METIAVVHWVDVNGGEKMRNCYTQFTLNKITQELSDKNLMNWTMLCSGEAAVPIRPPKRHLQAI